MLFKEFFGIPTKCAILQPARHSLTRVRRAQYEAIRATTEYRIWADFPPSAERPGAKKSAFLSRARADTLELLSHSELMSR